MIAFLLVLFAIVVLGSFPATWLLMLFIGSLAPAAGLSFWGALPGGILVTFFVAGGASGGYGGWRNV